MGYFSSRQVVGIFPLRIQFVPSRQVLFDLGVHMYIHVNAPLLISKLYEREPHNAVNAKKALRFARRKTTLDSRHELVTAK